jgi:hypothetical protein
MKPSELLADPVSWTKETLARDVEGKPCESDSIKAVCWCLVGAVERCYGVYSIDSTAVIGRIYHHLYPNAIDRMYWGATGIEFLGHGRTPAPTPKCSHS